MIYVFMALYAEAKPLIEKLELKKINSRFKFTQYESPEICLTITGVGSIAASTAVGAVCASRDIDAADILVNIGSCAGSASSLHGIYLIHKITDEVTGRTYYPDMLYKHTFDEVEIITIPSVKTREKVAIVSNPSIRNTEKMQTISNPSVRMKGKMEVATASLVRDEEKQELISAPLYDMEAAAIYQAGSYFVGPHQMRFLKVVSDEGNGATVTPDMLTECMHMHVDEMAELLDTLQAITKEWQEQKLVFSEEETGLVVKLCDDLHCSAVMKASVEQLCRYWKLSGIDYEAYISQMYAQGLLPCKDKREGKRRIDAFRKELL